MNDTETAPPPATPAGSEPTGPPVLSVRDVDVTHRIAGGRLFAKAHLHALTGARISVRRGEVLGIVGESGCGKSTLARVLVGLQKPTAGVVRFHDEDLWGMPATRRASEFGGAVGMVFQDASTALNRRLTVRTVLRDPLDVHGRGTKAQREARVREVMDLVGLPPSAAEVLPGQLSGGQRQRVAIARALVLEPEVIVADEPTSALDVSVRAQILNLLRDLKDRLGLGLVFISHDIQTVRYLADRIAVMYLGRVVEEGPAERIVHAPRHPYTVALFSATPSLLASTERITLTGPLPSAVDPPSGCAFRTRCWKATDVCAQTAPEPRAAEEEGHLFRCHHPM
ncbi:oligopeptide/dipeptide ABC transporter ATP-binding protein [Streptomyces sp. SID3343]|uniref:ABC transporter ATP-binding protein n=1 Tax=Streptomyces sp. SID3343 TaxID=2690260 RepID=UPI00136A060F|nr:oligopeptide/dipeptide ABC transporter ATP-binding protein [Streptomyces sp. SID3343]MYW03589.1 ATP-binding cassette domain-containing protein [Streptomyces sp. SID3343]